MGNSITQKLKYKQSVVKFSYKYGVTKASIKFGENRRTIYRWRERYDGTLESLKEKSRKPNHHPNEHTEKEIKLIFYHSIGGIVAVDVLLDAEENLNLGAVDLSQTQNLLTVRLVLIGADSALYVKGDGGMLGKSDRRHPCLDRREHDLLGGIPTVTEGGMCMQIAFGNG